MNKIQSFVLGPLEANSYLLAGRYLIDAAGFNDELKNVLFEVRNSFEAVLITHAHGDHIGGLSRIKQMYPECSVYCHSEAEQRLADPELNLSGWLGEEITFSGASTFKNYQPEIEGENIKVIPTPGHTPGGVAFYWPSEKALFSGDTLFKNSVGRADLTGGNMEVLINSIKEKLLVLPEDTVVYPGHGPTTTIKAEKESNPYL